MGELGLILKVEVTNFLDLLQQVLHGMFTVYT